MAEEATQQKNEVQRPKKSLKTIIILMAVFLLEGGGISLFWVLKGGPEPAEATDPIEQTQANTRAQESEVILAEGFQVVNYEQGRSRMMVTLDIAAKVDSANQLKLEDEVKGHSKEILNTIREVVSSAQPEQIKDPQLQVIKRDLKTGIEEIVSEGLIKDILIPSWAPYSDD
ncbi:MAG: flagellar basal body-associated FliL family protein [Sedimentisphaerales bacterium]|nr:flagellar basal body-associated FliL family protein [Sedimentisphaerales bacterium]